MDLLETFVHYSVLTLNFIGVAIITFGGIYAAVGIVLLLIRKQAEHDIFYRYRRRIGRVILVGLEFLVATSVLRTVVVRPTFKTIGILGLIVLIRTVMSFALQMEMALNRRRVENTKVQGNPGNPYESDGPGERENAGNRGGR